MITLILIGKIVFLFMAILLTIANIVRVQLNNTVPWQNTVWQAIGITGFIVLQWLI